MFRPALLAAVALGGALLIAPMDARATNLVTNGDFTTTTGGSTGQLGYSGFNATGWTNGNYGGGPGYNFIFASGTSDTTGSNGVAGNVKLWGPNDGSANGLPASSPTGGNFVGADGAYEVAAISQTITGLTAGTKYVLSFYWAGAQQSGFTGVNTEQWQVSLGSSTQSTVVANNVSEGFTGWMQATMTFTADNTSDVLSFLSVGTPNGEPPFTLLDGVSMVVVPEPASAALLLAGVVGVAGVRFRARRPAAV